jgi:NADH-quinone oxidoreductase subunit L
MRWPLLALAVPTVGLGFAFFAEDFARALGADEGFHLGAQAAAPLTWVGLGTAAAWWLWHTAPRPRPATDLVPDPARVLGPMRPLFGTGFYLDAVQDVLVVRPVRALARAVRWGDESIVDGAVEETGTATVGLSGLVARWHRAGLPRALTAVLGGAVLIGLAAVAVVEVWP